MVMILQGRTLEARLETELKAMGLSMRRLGLLGHLKRDPGISYSALARRAGIKVQSLHPIVTGLIDEGYVKAVGGVSQGQAARIELTQRGVDALGQAEQAITACDDAVFAEREWKQVGDALVVLGKATIRGRTPEAD